MTSWQVEIRHNGLNKYQIVRGSTKYIAEQKAAAKLAQWEEMWERKLERERRAQDKAEKMALAVDLSTEAQANILALETILLQTLQVDDAVEWDAIKNFADFSKKQPKKPHYAEEPARTDDKYGLKLTIMERLFREKKLAKIASLEKLFQDDRVSWEKSVAKADKAYITDLANWEKERDAFVRDRDAHNALIDQKRNAYYAGEVDGILEYFDMVLTKSQYPDYFPQVFDIQYVPENNLLVVDYQLPDIADIPKTREVKYIQTRDEFKEYDLSNAQFNKLYDSALYQVALRTIHEIFESDKNDAVTVAVFNGVVESIDPADGQRKSACILTVQASKEEFVLINLSAVDPKACFKSLKGIGSTRLYSLTPVAPLIKIDREDRRFIDSYPVVDELGDEENLAAMDWEDFEHLVRELFEKEFASTGGEVKVTQASRDGGIDAVAFDPDPIRGGKLVIQAKRYTNTVGVSAVRDLYGAVINEGAAKGILVTTTDYGADAYDFAKGKPLTLLNGNNLLHLLEKHGYQAKIDIKEAKRILADKERNWR